MELGLPRPGPPPPEEVWLGGWPAGAGGGPPGAGPFGARRGGAAAPPGMWGGARGGAAGGSGRPGVVPRLRPRGGRLQGWARGALLGVLLRGAEAGDSLGGGPTGVGSAAELFRAATSLRGSALGWGELAEGFSAREESGRARQGNVRVEWRGYVWLDTGYASELRSFVLGLDRLGHLVTPVAEELVYDVVGHKAFAQLPDHVSVRLSEIIARPRAAGEGGLVVHHGNRAFVDISRGDLLDYHIFRGVWETSNQDFADKQDPSWQADEIWVASWHTYHILREGGMPHGRIRHVPQGFSLTAFPTDAPPLPLPGRGRFNFLSIFAWSKRKGWDVLIRAFVQEFPPELEESAQNAVTLTLKVSGFRSNTLEVAKAQRDGLLAELGISELPSNILWVDRSLADTEMASLYAAADAFVLPSRAEGWGRPFMEAMAMGVPVIGTGWGGQMDFMNASNSYLLPYRLVAAEQEFEAFSMGGHMWAEVEPGSLQSGMRHILENSGDAQSRAKSGQAFVRRSYSEEAVMAKASEVLNEATQQMTCVCAHPEKSNSAGGAAVCAKQALKEGRAADSLACFRERLARLSQSPGERRKDEMDALLGLGIAYFLRGGIVMASKAFQQCMDSCPQMAVAQKTNPLNSELFRQALVLCPAVRLALLSKGFVFAEAWLHEGGRGEKVHEDFWSMALFSATESDQSDVCRLAQMLSMALTQPMVPESCSDLPETALA